MAARRRHLVSVPGNLPPEPVPEELRCQPDCLCGGKLGQRECDHRLALLGAALFDFVAQQLTARARRRSG